jgi:hypothetical protein
MKQMVRKAARTEMGRRIVGTIFEPPVGGVAWGDLRRTIPLNRHFGHGRGEFIDRAYIEAFLAANAHLIRGTVLEVAEDTYTRRFGAGKVERCDVLHAVEGNPGTSIVADLQSAPSIGDCQYDCIVLTQTLQMISDMSAAVATTHRILKPGGSVLATISGISQASRSDNEQWGDKWRCTSRGATALFASSFDERRIEVVGYGNVLTATAFLQGLSVSDLTAAEVAFHDPDYEVLVAVRATRAL